LTADRTVDTSPLSLNDCSASLPSSLLCCRNLGCRCSSLYTAAGHHLNLLLKQHIVEVQGGPN